MDESTVSEDDMTVIASEVVRHKPIGSLVVGGKTERATEHRIEEPSILKSVAGLFSNL